MSKITGSIPQPRSKEEAWIAEWKKCKCSELVDCFHYRGEDLNLVRRRKYYLPADTWRNILSPKTEEKKKSLIEIRIHMAINNSDKENPCFYPILEPIYLHVEPLNIENEKPEKSYYILAVDPEYDLQGKIPEVFKSQLITNWMYVHPGFLVDQFETITDPNKLESLRNGRDKKPVERKRVNYYRYMKDDIEKMRDIPQTYSYVIFHLGVNHNDDRFGVTSFAPVIHFGYLISENNKMSKKIEDHYFEFATPCPPLCSGDNL